jgi:DNA polymerase-1
VVINLAGNKLSEAKNFTSEEVKNSLGVYPNQVVDYKALVGDHSDNIPGVPGIGEKTAVSLLEQYRTLDEVYAHLAEIPARFASKLESGKDSAYLSQNLATIRTDVEITLNIQDARTDHINAPAIEKLFRELEFRSLIPRLHTVLTPLTSAGTGGSQLNLFGEEVKKIGLASSYTLETIVVDNSEKLHDLARVLKSAKMISLDTETTSTDPLRSKLVGMSFAVKEGTGYYIPIGHKTGAPQLPLEDVVDALQAVLSDPSIQKVGHNLKYDGLVLEQNGLPVTPMTFDTMIAGWLIDPASRAFGLKDMAGTYLDLSMTHIEELIGKGKTQTTMDFVTVENAAPYAAADAEVSLRLVSILQEKMKANNATGVFEKIEMPLVPVLMQMEAVGIALDKPYLKKMGQELGERLDGIVKEIQDEVGYSFNLNSTQQLSKVLFETLKLTPPDARKKTSSGHYSTSASVLEELSGQHPVVDKILEYRELAKLKSTYLDALPESINPRDGRVHTSYNQTGSVTGRLASTDPNLQNIPIRTDTGRLVRNGFISDPGSVLLSVDYSQIELRIVAHMSGDEAMLDAFRAGQDIHATTAAAILNIPLSEVTREQRRHAKAINFGLIYGMSSFGLSRGTSLTLGEAENFVREYFEHFPRVKSFLDNLKVQAAKQGYVETILGRRRYFPNLASTTNVTVRRAEEREAINAPIQGTAADIMKIAMINLPPALNKASLNAKLMLQVHDELVLEVPEKELQTTARLVQKVMSEALTLSIPLLTEAKSGVNWGNMTPLKEQYTGK